MIRRIVDYVIPALVGVLLAFSVWQGILNRAQGEAICALRHDLEKRVGSSQAFLKTHPHGIPGIPGVTIRKGISDQRRTIAALAPVSC